jgi:hypothetical protein
MHFTIFEYCAGLPQQTNIKGAGMKWDRRRGERSKIEEEEFTAYDQVCCD